MSNSLKGNARFWWIAGIGALFMGMMLAFVVLPAVSAPPGAGQPDVRVPKMENVPPSGAPKMRLDVEQEPK